MVGHRRVSFLTLTLGGKQEDQGDHGLGDEAEQVGLQAPDIHHLEHGGDPELVTELGHHLGVGLQGRPPLPGNLGLCVSDLCHDQDLKCVTCSF